VIHHELDDDSGVLAEVLEADNPHDVGSVLGVRLLAELVGKDEASCGLSKFSRLYQFTCKKEYLETLPPMFLLMPHLDTCIFNY